MIKYHIGDITKIKDVDYICNAANAIGPMGAGVAGAIRYAGGKVIEMEAFKVCKQYNPHAGSIYVTNAGTLPYKKILHLVSMNYPGGVTSLQIIKELLDNLVILCHNRNIDKIALPALGTGVGGLDYKEVAKLYVEILQPVDDIDFIVVDINKTFITYIDRFLVEDYNERNSD